MIKSPIRAINITKRAPETPPDAPLGQPGDEFEILDAPVYQVDPVTQKCTTKLQMFRVERPC